MILDDADQGTVLLRALVAAGAVELAMTARGNKESRPAEAAEVPAPKDRKTAAKKPNAAVPAAAKPKTTISLQAQADTRYAELLNASHTLAEKELATKRLEKRKEREAALPISFAPPLVSKYTINHQESSQSGQRSVQRGQPLRAEEVAAHVVTVHKLSIEEQQAGPAATPGGWLEFWLTHCLNGRLLVLVCGQWAPTVALIAAMERQLAGDAEVEMLGLSRPLSDFVSRTGVVALAIDGKPPTAAQLAELGVKQVWPPVVVTTFIGGQTKSKGSSFATSCLLVLATRESEVWAAGDLTGVPDRKSFLPCAEELELPPMQHVTVQLKGSAQVGELEDVALPALCREQVRVLGLLATLKQSRMDFRLAPKAEDAAADLRRTVVVLTSAGAQQGADNLVQACKLLQFFPAIQSVVKQWNGGQGTGPDHNETKFKLAVEGLQTIYLEVPVEVQVEVPPLPQSDAVKQ
jgi:hypothetical protein